jgi:hypothetical protein
MQIQVLRPSAQAGAVPLLPKLPQLQVAVAKKRVRRAVYRNTVRRVLKEQWRLFLRSGPHPSLNRLRGGLRVLVAKWPDLPDGQAKREIARDAAMLFQRLA